MKFPEFSCGVCGHEVPCPAHTTTLTVTIPELESAKAEVARLTAENSRLRAALEKVRDDGTCYGRQPEDGYCCQCCRRDIDIVCDALKGGTP